MRDRELIAQTQPVVVRYRDGEEHLRSAPIEIPGYTPEEALDHAEKALTVGNAYYAITEENWLWKRLAKSDPALEVPVEILLIDVDMEKLRPHTRLEMLFRNKNLLPEHMSFLVNAIGEIPPIQRSSKMNRILELAHAVEQGWDEYIPEIARLGPQAINPPPKKTGW